MKIFQQFNEVGKCLVCKTNENKPCCLIGIVGSEDGHNMMAEAVHMDCLELYYYPEAKIIAMKVEDNKE